MTEWCVIFLGNTCQPDGIMLEQKQRYSTQKYTNCKWNRCAWGRTLLGTVSTDMLETGVNIIRVWHLDTCITNQWWTLLFFLHHGKIYFLHYLCSHVNRAATGYHGIFHYHILFTSIFTVYSITAALTMITVTSASLLTHIAWCGWGAAIFSTISPLIFWCNMVFLAKSLKVMLVITHTLSNGTPITEAAKSRHITIWQVSLMLTAHVPVFRCNSRCNSWPFLKSKTKMPLYTSWRHMGRVQV